MTEATATQPTITDDDRSRIPEADLEFIRKMTPQVQQLLEDAIRIGTEIDTFVWHVDAAGWCQTTEGPADFDRDLADRIGLSYLEVCVGVAAAYLSAAGGCWYSPEVVERLGISAPNYADLQRRL